MGGLLGSSDLLLKALPEKSIVIMKTPINCVWFKRDLRIHDHTPLANAAQSGGVLPVYIIEPEVIQAADFDALHWQFIQESLLDLQTSLSDLGAPLQVLRGSAVDVFKSLFDRYNFSTLWAHEETGNAITYKRDRAVAKWAASKSVSFVELPQNGVVRCLQDRDGWSKPWEQRMRKPQINAPGNIACPDGLKPSAIPTVSDLRLSQSTREIDIRGGEKAGLEILQSFIQSRGQRYHREMSSPNTAYDSCSRLSAYLAWGCVSMRTVVQAVRLAAGEQMPKIAARAFLSRCHWHCHFMQKLESEPGIEFHAFNRACDDLRSENNGTSQRFEAWKNGSTGYPFVDACIRSLKARGWINFRMRAMLVSFASYHLWLDWRLFKDWLACQFIDYEPGIHISQIQMQSGLTGINTLRIYNPIKQGQDHDLHGVFIRRWVPEISAVEDAFIHEPWKMSEHAQVGANCKLGVDYPLPVVDHKEAVRYARARFSELRKRDDYWQSAREVM
ncbi:MAG: deoxyribodipyrimidine photo-lyase, partial [Zhongshania aliphaticivorans]